LAALVDRAGRGDEDAVPELRELLREPALWRHPEGLAAAVQDAWQGHLAAEGFTAGDGPTPTSAAASKGGGHRALDRLLTGYVQAWRLVAAYATGRADAASGLPPSLVAELRKRVAAANRRLRAAEKRLELVRRLLV
jgi:hypothetical protein